MSELKQGTIISVASRKGGVGKTTVTRNLSDQLAKMGYKVLVVDADSQGNLSLSYGCPKTQKPEGSLYDLLWDVANDQPEQQYIKCIQSHEGVDIIPCNESLAALEMYLVTALDREKLLSYVLDGLRGKYDFIFIDCGPSLGLITINALTASDKVLIVTNLEEDANVGAELLIQSIQRVRKKLNPKLDVEGILINMAVRRSILGTQILREIQETYGNIIPVYSTRIPQTTEIGKARKAQKSVTDFSPSSKAADSFRIFCKEFIRKGGYTDGCRS